MTGSPLKLLAQDAEDLQVIAAVLQDSIAPVSEMTFRAAERNFVMIVQRFCWDGVTEEGAGSPLPAAAPPAPPPAPAHSSWPDDEACPSCVYDRVNCALDIEDVESVQFVGFSLEDPAALLELLTMRLEEGFLHLIFAGGAKIRLRLGNWQLRLADFGESWPTTHCPRHSA